MTYTRGVQNLWHVLKMRDGQVSITICGLRIRMRQESNLISDEYPLCTNCKKVSG